MKRIAIFAETETLNPETPSSAAKLRDQVLSSISVEAAAQG